MACFIGKEHDVLVHQDRQLTYRNFTTRFGWNYDCLICQETLVTPNHLLSENLSLGGVSMATELITKAVLLIRNHHSWTGAFFFQTLYILSKKEEDLLDLIMFWWWDLGKNNRSILEIWISLQSNIKRRWSMDLLKSWRETR